MTLQALESSAPRDLFLNARDIDNLAVKHNEAAWKLDACPAQSIRLFTQRFPDNVLFYQEQALLPGDLGVLPAIHWNQRGRGK